MDLDLLSFTGARMSIRAEGDITACKPTCFKAHRWGEPVPYDGAFARSCLWCGEGERLPGFRYKGGESVKTKDQWIELLINNGNLLRPMAEEVFAKAVLDGRIDVA